MCAYEYVDNFRQLEFYKFLYMVMCIPTINRLALLNLDIYYQKFADVPYGIGAFIEKKKE